MDVPKLVLVALITFSIGSYVSTECVTLFKPTLYWFIGMAIAVIIEVVIDHKNKKNKEGMIKDEI